MDYPRALDSSPEDRGLGVRDCTETRMMCLKPGDSAAVFEFLSKQKFDAKLKEVDYISYFAKIIESIG